MATPRTTTRRAAPKTVDAEHEDQTMFSKDEFNESIAEAQADAEVEQDEEGDGYREEAEPTETEPQAIAEDQPQKVEHEPEEVPPQVPQQPPVQTPVQQQPPQPAAQQGSSQVQPQNPNLPAVQQAVAAPPSNVQAGFNSHEAIVALQRISMPFTESELVPARFQGRKGLASCMIALDMSIRMGVNPLMIMQNLYVVNGQPGWSAQFLIASFNTTKRFEPILYRMTGEKGKDSWGYVAYSYNKTTGELIDGIEITMAMAKAEGWYEKKGSKWKTMPELMLKYRSAAFLIRTTAPEIAMGLLTAEELQDIDAPQPTISNAVKRPVIDSSLSEE